MKTIKSASKQGFNTFGGALYGDVAFRGSKQPLSRLYLGFEQEWLVLVFRIPILYYTILYHTILYYIIGCGAAEALVSVLVG